MTNPFDLDMLADTRGKGRVRTTYTARSPVGYVIRTPEPTVAAELSRGGYRVSARTTDE